MHPSGEVSIEIKGKSYRMRPSFKCLSRIEEITNTGISKIVMSMAGGDIRFSHMAAIIHQAILAGEDRPSAPSYEEIGEWLMKGNMPSATQAIIPFFQEALAASPKDA
jgi:hypothetical protein